MRSAWNSTTATDGSSPTFWLATRKYEKFSIPVFPNIRSTILHQQVLTPLDIERITGLTEGNIFQGELSLEQLFFNRPVPGWARYRTPIKDLWMCGSATHPGGGIMGAPGRIAALELMKSQRAGTGGRKGRAA